MFINEAAKKAVSNGKAMILERDNIRICILPTNTKSGIIEMSHGGSYLHSWHPQLSDLLSDRWCVSDNVRIIPLPSDKQGPTGRMGISQPITVINQHGTADKDNNRSNIIDHEEWTTSDQEDNLLNH